MKRKRSHRLFAVIVNIIGIVFLIGLVLAVAIVLVCHRLCFADYTQYHYTESTNALTNPYIGWYTIHGYLLAEDADLSLPNTANEPDTATESSQNLANDSANNTSSDSASEPGLALLEINLTNYANCDLTDTALTEIDSILSAWTQRGNQLIVRFLYDWDGQNLAHEPKELSQILTHMEQVGPIVNQYAPSVYLMQGIFVGNWGEMNNTIHIGNGEMETLVQKLADVIDPSIFLSVRTPAHWRTIVGDSTAGDGDAVKGRADGITQPTLLFPTSPLASRLGLFNDGILGSANDTGTYGNKVAADANTNYSDAWTREDELAFQNELCRYVPNGGEVTIDNVYNDFDNAIKDLAQMHVSYLNSAYDSAVLNKWRETTVTGTTMTKTTTIGTTTIGNDIVESGDANSTTLWNGMNGYDYIERHLGYRYVLDNSSFKFYPLFDDTGMLTVRIRNVGFSNCYRPLDVTVYVVSDLTGECIAEETVDTDPRLWNSGETSSFTVPIDIRSLHNESDTNTYTLYLKCTDLTLNRTILFANTQALTEYGYELGSLTVSTDLPAPNKIPSFF